MRLKALDQIHISSVQADVIRPGEMFSVDDTLGESIMKDHPNTFERQKDIAAKAEKSAPKNKAEPAPLNKIVAPASNKAD